MKVDFVVCWDDQTWSTEHTDVPDTVVDNGSDDMEQWFQDNIVDKLPKRSGGVSGIFMDFVYKDEANDRAYLVYVRKEQWFEKEFMATCHDGARRAAQEELEKHEPDSTTGWQENPPRILVLEPREKR